MSEQRYPQWKIDMWRTRPRPCSCRQEIPGVQRGRTNPSCSVHGWEGDRDAEQGRSVVENDAIQREHSTWCPGSTS